MIWLRLGLIAAALASAAWGGWWVRDADAAKAEAIRLKGDGVARLRAQERSNEAGQEVERRLAIARAAGVSDRADADRVRDLAGRIRASEQASERDRERIRVLSELVAEGARVAQEGLDLVGRLDARLAGCQAAPP